MVLRGLYQEQYSVFKQGLPCSLAQPLGTKTFREENNAYCHDAPNKEEQRRRERSFGVSQHIPPCVKRLFTWRASLHSPKNNLLAAWAIEETYKRSFPKHPLSDNVPAQVTVSILIALAFEGPTYLQKNIHRVMADVLATVNFDAGRSAH